MERTATAPTAEPQSPPWDRGDTVTYVRRLALVNLPRRDGVIQVCPLYLEGSVGRYRLNFRRDGRVVHSERVLVRFTPAAGGDYDMELVQPG